jgi:hypothetical protein
MRQDTSVNTCENDPIAPGESLKCWILGVQRGEHSHMGKAGTIKRTESNRRQIFRIADPEFAQMSVLIKAQDTFIECTCLDISATGIGILVPQSRFEGATPGAILEYKLFFGMLSPVKGFGIVANRAETALEDNLEPLLRIGLRFSDAPAQSGHQRSDQGRRSQRHFLLKPLRPLCVCSDPLWLGDDISIAIHDFSIHGLSGMVSAKKTVFAEGLRTVFRFGFPHLGTFEIPVRIIYANPTEDHTAFRIGCEFVRRPKEFVNAVESFLTMFLLDKDGTNSPSSYLMAQSRVLSNNGPIEDARSVLNKHLATDAASNPSMVYCQLQNNQKNSGDFFRYQVINQNDQDGNDEASVTDTAGRKVITFSLDDAAGMTDQSLRDAISTVLYLAAVSSVEAVQFITTHPSLSESRAKLRRAGLHSLDLGEADNLIFELRHLLRGEGITLALWMRSFVPLGRYQMLLNTLFKETPILRRVALMGTAILLRNKPLYQVSLEGP